MKIFVVFLFLLVTPIELRRHNNDIIGLDDVLNEGYNNKHKHRPIRPNLFDETADDDNNNNNNDNNNDDDRGDLSPYDFEKISSSRKKILDDNDRRSEESEDKDTSEPLKPTNPNKEDLSDKSSCVNKYDVQLEQLVKVKELDNGARMIRYDIIDKRTLPSNLNVQDSCMMNCCEQPMCDLAMLSEKPTEKGFKCYLFLCNGSCPLTSHQDYKVMIPKKYSTLYTKSVEISSSSESTSTVAYVNMTRKKSYFREISVILLLVFGLLCTIFLFVLLCCYCRKARKMGRKSKNYSVDADYLINGLYL